MASDTRNQQGQPSSGTTRARTAWRTSGLLWYGFIISGIMSFAEELGGKTRAAMDANYNVWRELMVENIEKCIMSSFNRGEATGGGGSGRTGASSS